MSQEAYDSRYTCPVCGYLSFKEPPGSYAICSVCFWEDDTPDLFDPFPCAGGPNDVSLLEAQRNFVEFGASEIRLRKSVRPPAVPRDPTWRRVDPGLDVFDVSREFERHFRAETMPRGSALYYWRDDYWAKAKLSPLDWHNPAAEPSYDAPRLSAKTGFVAAADPCPCCGYLTFEYDQKSWGKIYRNDICPICFWHEDTLLSHQGASGSLFDAFHREDGSAPNNVSLIVAQRNFLVFGAADPMRQQFVRAITATDMRDPQWRRVNPSRDVFDSERAFRSENHIVRFKLRVHKSALWYWHDDYHLKGLKQPLAW